MKQNAQRDLLVGTVVRNSICEKGVLKAIRHNVAGTLCWLIDWEMRGLAWVPIAEVQTYEIV